MAETLQELIVKIRGIQQHPVNYMRPVVLVLAGQVRYRIHVLGRRPDGGEIGRYDSKYLLLRQKKYNRTSETKMVYSLTRQMEQDFVGIAENNQYGLGFNNSHNFDKATWQEEMRPGVYDLSDTEIDLVETTITDYINGLLG